MLSGKRTFLLFPPGCFQRPIKDRKAVNKTVAVEVFSSVTPNLLLMVEFVWSLFSGCGPQ